MDYQSPSFELSIGPYKVSWFLNKQNRNADVYYRFECSYWHAGKWQSVPGALAFTTDLTDDCDSEVLLAASQRVIQILEDSNLAYSSPKTSDYVPRLELLSWMNRDNFKLRYILETVGE
jgi:hypothetical protein